MEELFNSIDILEKWWNNGIISLEDYLKIKSSLVDYYRPHQEKESEDDLPF